MPRVLRNCFGSVVARKLDMVDYAQALGDLASPPANKLEALKADLKGLYSWTDAGPTDVNVVDYH
jgi:toxin HigB-1